MVTASRTRTEPRGHHWLLGLVVVAACTRTTSAPSTATAPAVPLERISIVGASVSAGFGGPSFADAFAAVGKGLAIDNHADVMMFRDPLGNSRTQIEAAIAWKPTLVVALDFLFWDVYGASDPGWRERALAAGLAALERARAAGAWIVVGDVPLVVTAADWMLPREQVPDPTALAQLNATIASWARGRERVLFVPFAAWAEPLAKGGDIELAPGEKVNAAALMALDGLHANPLGVWYLLDRLDRLIEATYPGTPAHALVFVRPH